MASQPLETIPEEPTPTPTPPNSPAPARVTADPPQTKPAKNPGRVESGKRLAERNRLAREAKKQAKAEAASPVTATASASDTATATASDNSSLSLSIGGFAAAVVEANTIALLTLVKLNCLAIETACVMTKAVLAKMVKERQQQNDES